MAALVLDVTGDLNNDTGSADLPELLDLLRRGDVHARRVLTERAIARLRHFVAIALAETARLRRWEQSDDVVQQAAMRLWRSLEEVRPATAEAFFGLCSLMTRRTILDLARKHFGPEGMARFYDSPRQSEEHPALAEASGEVGVTPLEMRLDIHAAVERLSHDRRVVTDLVLYQGLTLGESARVLGVSEKTVSRRWREARLELAARLRELAVDAGIDDDGEKP